MNNFTQKRQKPEEKKRRKEESRKGKGKRETDFLIFPQNLSVVSIANPKSKLAEFLYIQASKFIRLYLKTSE